MVIKQPSSAAHIYIQLNQSGVFNAHWGLSAGRPRMLETTEGWQNAGLRLRGKMLNVHNIESNLHL